MCLTTDAYLTADSGVVFSSRVVVSYKRKYVHEVLVKLVEVRVCSSLPRIKMLG